LGNNKTESAKTVLTPPPDLNVMRTLMAADRTLMAWIRTALSLLSFSFAIYKILEELHEGLKLLPYENSPRNVGIFLAVLGTVGMIMGTVEYYANLRQLLSLQRIRLVRPSLIMALFISTIGVLLCVGIIKRLI
jgi:putative membrane protein